MIRRLTAAALAASFIAGAAVADTRDLSAIPHLTVHYYDVGGLTARQVRADLNRVGPIDPSDRKRMDAMTLWEFKWSWPGYGRAQCDLGSAAVEYKIDLTLPRLVVTDETPTALKLKWKIYLDALTEHEFGHVNFARDHAPDVLAAIKGSTCLGADAAAHRILDEITRHDIEYDAETDHGVKQGVHLP